MVLLGGDFNCPGIDWFTGLLIDSYLSRTSQESLISFAHDFLLEQINTTPTRGSNILDLCFTSHPDYILQCCTVPGLSDHDAVVVDLVNFVHLCTKRTKQVYCYNKADWDSIHEKLVHLTENYFRLNEDAPRNVEQNQKFFHEGVIQIMQKFIPTKQRSKTNHLP